MRHTPATPWTASVARMVSVAVAVAVAVVVVVVVVVVVAVAVGAAAVATCARQLVAGSRSPLRAAKQRRWNTCSVASAKRWRRAVRQRLSPT